MKDTFLFLAVMLPVMGIILFGTDHLYKMETENTRLNTEWCLQQNLKALSLNEFKLCRKLLPRKYD